MNKILLILSAILILASCKKSDTNPRNTYVEPSWYFQDTIIGGTLNIIYKADSFHSQGSALGGVTYFSYKRIDSTLYTMEITESNSNQTTGVLFSITNPHAYYMYANYKPPYININAPFKLYVKFSGGTTNPPPPSSDSLFISGAY